ncbi:hypothetical protein L1987_60674 [Smallanthus sonchifolius]|uniref:Uncharacterized protein n=1 Tax=Smallanthus sonchifolius TaxID=185202 RepID=A0ACB9D8N0_9ASTR|nr:hypothetical protein L1987_60674 [Smallanthus sonchifolius]
MWITPLQSRFHYRCSKNSHPHPSDLSNAAFTKDGATSATSSPHGLIGVIFNPKQKINSSPFSSSFRLRPRSLKSSLTSSETVRDLGFNLLLPPFSWSVNLNLKQ